ncbi:hypothetical protein VTK26DRAFT_2561 [Humicola hyalothermophila]
MVGMDKNQEDQDEGADGPLPSSQERILDRKIEKRALPDSFSSNLGRKGPSTRRDISDGSVKAMISLFEQSLSRPASPTPGRARTADESDRYGHYYHSGDADAKVSSQPHRPEKGDNHIDTTIPPASLGLPFAQIGSQVEAYSLTLLKHKCYFNNRPLARCLDAYREETEDKKPQQAVREMVNDEKAGVEGKENRKPRRQEENVMRDAAARAEDSSPIQKLDDLINELSIWQGIHGTSTLNPPPKRDPAEVNGFWSRVRAHLWIDEDDIEERRESGNKDERGTVLDVDREITDSQETDSQQNLSFLPPPAPTRPPPPVPTSFRESKHSIASLVKLFPDPDSDYPDWDQPPPTPSVRMSISAPGFLNVADLLLDSRCEPELPDIHFHSAESKSSPSVQNADDGHARRPRNSSGAWVRPPPWRSPSIGLSPGTLAMPLAPMPAPTPQPHYRHHQRHRSSRRQQQAHNHRPSEASTSTAGSSLSTTSVNTGSSGGRGGGVGKRTSKTPTSSPATTRSVGAGPSSSTGSWMAAHAGAIGEGKHRRLTTEEKLSEIDAFLSD